MPGLYCIIFKEQFLVNKIWGRQRFPLYPFTQVHGPPTTNVPYQSGTFVTTDIPALAHYYHPWSVVYLRVHSQCCTSYTFGRMHSDMHPVFPFLLLFVHSNMLIPMQDHREQFHCQCFVYCSSCPLALRSHWSLCLHSFAFSRVLYSSIRECMLLLKTIKVFLSHPAISLNS